jgi:hypothetical protein
MISSAGPSGTASEHRKVTYSLPGDVAGEVDRRSRLAGMAKSDLVAEALTAYFASRDREELAQVYREAAADPLFAADNAAVLHDFAALDDDAAGGAEG